MGKVKKFTNLNIRKLSGGKDPIKVINDFLAKHGHDPRKCKKESHPDAARWMLSLQEGEELEILIEGIKNHQETTIYMGINVLTVPIRGALDILVTALEIADGLVGIKVSLVGHYLVLSSSLPAVDVSVEDLDYAYKLITAQAPWFREALFEELGLDEVET